MDYLWDTNILVHYVRQSKFYQNLDEKCQFFDKNNRVFISIVSVGEIYSLAMQRRWGDAKMSKLKESLESLTPLPIARQDIVGAYAIIDTFSQGKLLGQPLPKGLTPSQKYGQK